MNGAVEITERTRSEQAVLRQSDGWGQWQAPLPAALPSASAASLTACPASAEQRDALYSDFRPLIQRLIRKYGDEPELRKDLEGEIYCLFCDLLAKYDPARGVPLKPYLVHQLTATVYTFVRRRWHQERREVSLELEEGPTRPVDPSGDWDQGIVTQQIQGLLPEAMAKLPARQRQVVIWRYYEHRSFEDIAEVLGVRVATARSLLRHGVNNLRRSFAGAELSCDW